MLWLQYTLISIGLKYQFDYFEYDSIYLEVPESYSKPLKF